MKLLPIWYITFSVNYEKKKMDSMDPIPQIGNSYDPTSQVTPVSQVQVIKKTNPLTVAIVILATALITTFLIIGICLLVFYLIIRRIRLNIKNSFNVNLEEYCKTLPSTPSYRNIEMLTTEPNPGVYNVDLATALLDVAFASSTYNCLSQVVTPPTGFTYTEMKNGDVFVGFIYDNPTEKYAIIAFCGSLVLEQWGVDFEFSQVTNQKIRNISGTSLIHKGFYGAYVNQCQGIINTWISSITPSDYTLFVTGHSLGGALSTLCAVDLAKIGFGKISHYSFASPRVGNMSFVSDFNSVVDFTSRVNNTEDVIPQLPPAIFDNYIYEHVNPNVPFTYSYGNIGKNHTDAYKNYLPDCPLPVGSCESLSS